MQLHILPKLNELEQQFHAIYDSAKRLTGFDPLTASLEDYLHLRKVMLPAVDTIMQREKLIWHRIPRYTNDLLSMNMDNDVYVHECYIRFLPMDMHATESYEVFLCVSGKNRHYVGEDCVDLVPGDVLIVGPGALQASGAFDEGCVRRAVALRRSAVQGPMRALCGGDGPMRAFFQHTADGNTGASWCLLHGGKELLRDGAMSLLCQISPGDTEIQINLENGLLMGFFEHMEQVSGIGTQMKIETYQDITDEILHCIQVEFASIDRKQLAARFSYSERQLLRIIQKKTGMTFKEYLTKVRMDYVAEQLAKSAFPILHILESTGYENSQGFYDQFHARFGMTPREYRAMMAE